jgi:hypothetical protein
MNGSSINHGLMENPEIVQECSKFADQRKQDKLPWLQAPGQINVDNLNTVRHELADSSETKIGVHVKSKINELKKTVRYGILDLYRGIN